MKKKLFFSGMVLLALVLTAGTFAYTYAGAASATLDATISDEDFVTYESSAYQPDWESILPDGEFASEILLPCAAGDVTELTPSDPTKQNWELVDDKPADDGATYVATSSFNKYDRDLYNLTDHTEYEGVESDIKGITVYFRFADSSQTAYAKAVIKSQGIVIEGSQESQTGATYVTKSYQWTANPATGKRWTWQDINELQAGVSLKAQNKNSLVFCTQVYVAVNYKFVITESEVPRGNLYDITPHQDYSGDLQVKIYLTNTGDLLKAYRYLNMELYVANSLEAKKLIYYQVLSLENGVAIFNIKGDSAESYTVELLGGGYRLMSGDTTEWGKGWSIIPELYCEVTQR